MRPEGGVRYLTDATQAQRDFIAQTFPHGYDSVCFKAVGRFVCSREKHHTGICVAYGGTTPLAHVLLGKEDKPEEL